ncbi:ribose-phosphate pyrophosphokinase [archaeon]|nr:ribose-phosphate pyrophosphokinase [archaeon]
MSRGCLKLFANRSGEHFAEKLSKELKIPISQMKTLDFADGESKLILKESVRGCDAYVVQNCFDPSSERSIYKNFFELLQAGDALGRSGANKVTAVLPYHPFARQDKSTGREPLTARLAADLMHVAGFENVICSDLHAKQIVGFYKRTKIDNLPASNIILAHFKESNPTLNGNLVVMAPDAGGATRAEFYARKLQCRAAQAFKLRSNEEANFVEKLKVAGLVKGYNVLIVDDMIDTAGSVVKLVETLKEKEVNKIFVCCTHALLNRNAIENLSNLGVEVIATDSIPRTEEFKQKATWYKEVSLAPLFSKAIYNLNQDKSVSELYEDY